jgi:multimeric flavodoxin WrbA
MKIVSLLGSPRPNSNSSAIANRFTETAAQQGAEVRSFTLNNLTYRGCQGCYACKKWVENCVLKDDLAEVLSAVQAADVVVVASPVYYGDITSQLKGFMDRTFSYLKPDYTTSDNPSRLNPKKLVFIQTQGHADEARFGDIFPRYESFLGWMGFKDSSVIRACGIGPATVDEVPEEILLKAELAAKALLS